MRHFRHTTSRQNSHKTSHLIRRHERRAIARAQMLPVETLSVRGGDKAGHWSGAICDRGGVKSSQW